MHRLSKPHTVTTETSEMKLAVVALLLLCSLAGCGSTTPTAPPPSPVGSPAAEVDASAPADGEPAPSNSGDPAPSAAPLPTPTPDPDAVRQAALAWFEARATASPAIDPDKHYPDNLRGMRARSRDIAQHMGLYVAALKELEVPTDAAADLQELIRTATVYQAVEVERSTATSYRDLARIDRAGKAITNYFAARDRLLCDLGGPCYTD